MWKDLLSSSRYTIFHYTQYPACFGTQKHTYTLRNTLRNSNTTHTHTNEHTESLTGDHFTHDLLSNHTVLFRFVWMCVCVSVFVCMCLCLCVCVCVCVGIEHHCVPVMIKTFRIQRRQISDYAPNICERVCTWLCACLRVCVCTGSTELCMRCCIDLLVGPDLWWSKEECSHQKEKCWGVGVGSVESTSCHVGVCVRGQAGMNDRETVTRKLVVQSQGF